MSDLSPEQKLEKALQWIEAYPWPNGDTQRSFLAFVSHMRRPEIKKFSSPQTDLQCLAAFIFEKDIEATEWWRELVSNLESRLYDELKRQKDAQLELEQKIVKLEAELGLLARKLLAGSPGD